MNIAIAEDVQLDYESLHGILAEELQALQATGELYWFQTGEALLSDYAPEKYDLVLLDVLLGDGMTGMDTARALRAAGCRAPIVFTTGEQEYALAGYEVQAFDYLIKPCERCRVRAVLQRVLTALGARRYLTIPVEHGTQCLCTDDLMWAETCGHYVLLHMLGGNTVRSAMRFEELEALLPSQLQFKCCYRGILINLACVDTLRGSDFVLRDGQRVPVSRLKKTAMQKCLSDYAISRTREEMWL